MRRWGIDTVNRPVIPATTITIGGKAWAEVLDRATRMWHLVEVTGRCESGEFLCAFIGRDNEQYEMRIPAEKVLPNDEMTLSSLKTAWRDGKGAPVHERSAAA